MKVRGALFVNSVLKGIGAGNPVRPTGAFGGFKLIALLETHLEVVLPLRGDLLVHRALVVDVFFWLGHDALIL